MNLRLAVKGFQFYVSLTRLKPVLGVNSLLENGQHILMWDFDDVPIEDVESSLFMIQHKYSLPDIHIVRSSPTSNYHAYCFFALDFHQVCGILADTPRIDKAFFRIGICREFWTLRIQPKRRGGFLPMGLLESNVPSNVEPRELQEFCEYLTKR